MNQNKGQRVRNYFISETKVLLEKYERIESFLPSDKHKGAAHAGEEGRFVESLVREFLNKHLPKDLFAGTGFIYRPAAKTGDHDRTRRATEIDSHSKQLDIIVYDISNYPVFESFEEFFIVPPEGVIAIISVKKSLYQHQIDGELEALANAAALCSHYNNEKEQVRGPNTAIFSFSNKITSDASYDKSTDKLYEKIEKIHVSHFFDQCISQIVCLDQFTIFKRRPQFEKFGNFKNEAEYISFNHKDYGGYHYGLQLMLTGILSVYYDETRNLITRPGYTSFPLDRKHDKALGAIKVTKLR